MKIDAEDKARAERLREWLETSERSYVKSRHVPDMSSFEAARALRIAEERGWVETWSGAGNGKTYRVLL